MSTYELSAIGCVITSNVTAPIGCVITWNVKAGDHDQDHVIREGQAIAS